MKLSELVLAIGDEHIQLQNLLDSTDDIRQMKNGDTKVSFFTNQITATEVATGPTKMLGIVIWLPRALVEHFQCGAPRSGREKNDAPGAVDTSDTTAEISRLTAENARLAKENEAFRYVSIQETERALRAEASLAEARAAVEKMREECIGVVKDMGGWSEASPLTKAIRALPLPAPQSKAERG